MSADLERLSIEARELAEKYPKLLGNIIMANAQNLSATADLVRTFENASLITTDPKEALDQILSVEEATAETREEKKARILAIEDPLTKFKEILSIVRPPTVAELDILRQRGSLNFNIYAKSLGQLVGDDREGTYFEDSQMEHLNTVPAIRDYAPSTDFFVAFLPDDQNQVFLPDSNNEPQVRQAIMIEDFSKREIASILPDAVAIMLPAIGYTQADWAVFKREATRGQKLFKNFRVRTVERLSSGSSFAAGRINMNNRFLAHIFAADRGFDSIYAVPGLVFI